MRVFLNIIRFTGLVIFGLAVLLLLAAILNYFSSFTEIIWMEPGFIRLYLFFAVTGILAYILVTFRRRK
ncbi:hypothetical protein BB776_04215 [Planococcus salinarum]|uniref:Uncharacterized protein n=1 Tax=Planococcus salinarum TaxID=622695 RepID=A0ABX3CVW3_9BACL|nr:hypothetical protein [Planococcus salinarum]OHX49637.1 hypothetical protein BB776_04215 [Planococcus salinarum]TAA73512.1 hypothetical protein D2909_01310 [Planococcus salinarum]